MMTGGVSHVEKELAPEIIKCPHPLSKILCIGIAIAKGSI